MPVQPPPLPVRAPSVAPAVGPLVPASEEALVEIVREAAADQVPLHVYGHGTKAHVGPAAPADARGVSLRGLDRVVAYEPGDMVVTAQAGTKLAELQRLLAERGQWLPIDPPWADATIGGILATASAGPHRLGYGTVRDLLLGSRVVGATGVVTKSGGRVVKNVTGFDLHKLQVGAMGSLGLLVEASFKVAARPTSQAVFVLGCADLATAQRMLLAVWASPLRPSVLDAVDGEVAAGLRAAVPGLPAGAALAIVATEGLPSFVERHARDLVPPLVPAAPVRLADAHATAFWSAYQTLPAHGARDRMVARIATRPQALPQMLTAAEPRVGAAVHAATGVAHVRLPAELDARAAAELVLAWHAQARSLDGYAVVESAPLGLPERDALPWNPLAHDLLRSLKLRWDPNQILNRGRMPL